MVTTETVKEALNNGGLKTLFDKLDKDDALKALGILLILGVGKTIIDAIKEIVMAKK